jgi:TonB-linked SusC/RagA family outer membrane protein
MKTKFNGILTLLLALIVQISFAQDKTVSGTVSDNSGPLPGVSIVVKGTTTGTETDFYGKYAIKAATGDVLVFRYLGYKTTERKVGASNTLNVTLEEGGEVLDEIVVTAFGIKRNAKSLGYAVSNVAPDELQENSEPDLIRSLAGKVAGVDVNFSSGVAGASNRIQIRGQTTIGGASQPLFIVDGIAYDTSHVTTSSQTTGGGGYESAISSLDPNNIESVTVLKSATAAALYGSRATNGVIVIVTKSGSSKTGNTNKKLSIDVSTGLYFENIANLPEYQNTYGPGTNFNYQNFNGSWGARFDSRATIPAWPNLIDAFPDLFPVGSTVPYEAQPNNVEDLFRTGVVRDNSVTATSRTENGNFSVTISDLDQEGYIPFNTYGRTAFSVGGNSKLPNNLTVGASINYSETEQVGGFFGNNQFAGSASAFARALWLGRAWDFSLPYTHPVTGASVTPNNGYDHPLWSFENDQITSNSSRLVANLSLSYPINDNISTALRVGYNKYAIDREQVRHPQSRASALTGGTIQQDAFTNTDIEATFLVNFDYDLTENIGLTAITGVNALDNKTKRDATLGTSFISPGIFTLTNTLTQLAQFDFGARKRNIGVFGDVTLSFKDYLFLNVTGRNDWSSSLPKKNRSYFYSATSLSVILTEAFKIKNDVLTFAKLRGGYASVGRDADAEFLNSPFFTGTPFNNTPVINLINNDEEQALGDQEITPEFTDEIEIGLDLEFWNRRIALDFTYYEKVTTDLISAVSVPSSSGFDTFNTNIGEMTNKGIEIGLTLVPIQTENFKWTSFTTFTQNKNKVTELIEGLDRIRFDGNQVAHAEVGQPFGVFYGTRFARDAEGNYLINEPSGGIIQDPDDGVIGDPNPDFKIGFTNTFKYKNFTLGAQFDWREGGDIQSISINSLLGRGVTRDTEDRERVFVIPGFLGDGAGNPILDVNGNQIPNTTVIDANELYFSPAGSNTFGINTTDEGSVYDGTVYRLRELSLAYSMPTKWLEKTPFGKITLSAFGNNLWYFAPNVPKYTNFDPEVTSFGSGRIQGIENSSAPTSKRYGLKLNLTF